MAELERLFCRFCAEPKNPGKLIDLSIDINNYEEIVQKLAFLNAKYVEVDKTDSPLPKTVCFVCFETFNKAYTFLKTVREAQKILEDLFAYKPPVILNDDCDDDKTVFEDVPADDEKVKETTETKVTPKVEVKSEPKDEVSDPTLLENDSVDCHSSDSYDDDLNVQDILNAALSKSNVTIYANDASEISKNMQKKEIKTWREYPWICCYCNIEFLDVGTLKSHSRMVHGKCSPFTCIDCMSEFKNDFTIFVKHVRKHRKNLKKRCEYCDMSLSDCELSFHLKTHFRNKKHSCPACGEIFQSDALQAHLEKYVLIKPKRKPRRKRGTPITVDDLTCKICHKVYKNLNSLRDHVTRLHTGDRNRDYTCDRCGKMFYNKGTLTSHILTHDQIRPHTCRICNKSFLFPNMLRKHVQMHSGVKPFSCEQCGRCFRLQYQLNSHKIIHTDSMPHVCQYCNKAFRFKQILKNHERQHTGAKPYACQQCGMEFTNWSNYNKHMKRRHGTDTSKKKITPDGVYPVNPETGQLIQLHDLATEEWKSKIMIPAKRGKKKVIKEENLNS